MPKKKQKNLSQTHSTRTAFKLDFYNFRTFHRTSRSSGDAVVIVRSLRATELVKPDLKTSPTAPWHSSFGTTRRGTRASFEGSSRLVALLWDITSSSLLEIINGATSRNSEMAFSFVILFIYRGSCGVSRALKRSWVSSRCGWCWVHSYISRGAGVTKFIQF